MSGSETDKNARCVIKAHFTCDGTGRMCAKCGESEICCECEDDNGDSDIAEEDCEGCEGTGRFCVTHHRPCGDVGANPKCDFVLGREPKVKDDEVA